MKRGKRSTREKVKRLPTWTPVRVSKHPLRFAYDGFDKNGRRWRAWYADCVEGSPNAWAYAPIDDLTNVKYYAVPNRVDSPARYALEQLGRQLARG